MLCGDVVNIAVGIMVPCDGYIIEGRDITIDESSMTGETDMIHKSTLDEAVEKMNQYKNEGTFNTDEVDIHSIPSPILLSGTKVITGMGKFVVIVNGKYSC